jgi:hypothetical protein
MEQSLSVKPKVVQKLRKFLAFYEAQGSSICSQEPATDGYPESDGSNPHYHILFL